MREFAYPAELAAAAGQQIGTSDWLEVDQRTIDLFAEATGDHQWIHIDVERARREAPGGRTIAHGLLTLSLVGRLARSVYSVRNVSRRLNYGSNRVRHPAPVPAGSRIRLHMTVLSAEPVPGGFRIMFENIVEIEGAKKPALVAEMISQMYA